MSVSKVFLCGCSGFFYYVRLPFINGGGLQKSAVHRLYFAVVFGGFFSHTKKKKSGVEKGLVVQVLFDTIAIKYNYPQTGVITKPVSDYFVVLKTMCSIN